MNIQLQGSTGKKSCLRFQIEVEDALGVDGLDAADLGLGRLVVLGRDAFA